MLERWKEALSVAEKKHNFWEAAREESFAFNRSLGDLYGQVIRELDVLRGVEFVGQISHRNSITLTSKTNIEELVNLIGDDYNAGHYWIRGNIIYIQRCNVEEWNNIAIRAWFNRHRVEINIPWSITEEEIGQMLDKFGFTISHFEPTEIEDEHREHMTTQDFIELAKEFDSDLESWKKYLTESE